MSKIQIIRKGASRPVLMNTQTAHALVRGGQFSYVDPTPPKVSSAKPAPRAADAPRSYAASKVTQEEDLQAKTKEQVASLLESYGVKVDRRQSKADLVMQARRYLRRDMRAQ